MFRKLESSSSPCCIPYAISQTFEARFNGSSEDVQRFRGVTGTDQKRSTGKI